MSKPQRLSKACGQMTVELILLTVVFGGLSLFVSRFFLSQGIVQNLIQAPWNYGIAGMIENGQWGPVVKTHDFHPNLMRRHSSIKGEATR